MDVTRSLIAGYRSYASPAELIEVQETAPASTPAILSFIAVSSVACGSAVSVISASGIGTTIAVGC